MLMGASAQPVSVGEVAAAVKRLLDDGQWFLAYDAVREGLKQFPHEVVLHQLAARALIRLGAIDEARQILETLCQRVGASDEETVGLLARVYKDAWRESANLEDARRCRDMYLRAFRTTGGYWTCINAATMSWVLGRLALKRNDPASAQAEQALARDLAAQARVLCRDALASAHDEDRFWMLATLGEASLHLQDDAAAINAYQQAAGILSRSNEAIASARQQLGLLRRHGLAIPPAIFTALTPPTVVVFTGHMIDRPGRPHPRFPAELEPLARRLIEQCLDSLDARVGYSSAACGADLLFIEAMQARKAEVNIVLPFDAEDFIQTSVSHAGPQWVGRFRRALEIAGPLVTYATLEKYLGSIELFRYADHILHSLAFLRARSLQTDRHLVALYDGCSPSIRGGTADVVQRWPDPQRLHVIQLPRQSAPAQVAQEARAADDRAPAARSPAGTTRVIRTLLFADVVGFSKLHEEHIPYFLFEFLKGISGELRELADQPILVNTWGDAIFAVMREALPLVQYARTLLHAVSGRDWSKLGLPASMNVRIGLHAGPVYEGEDAITRRPNFFGSHVNRAARIEPITLPGHVYASQQFVGLLTSEQATAGEPAGGWPFVCEYLGTLSLAKNYGVLPVYHVREKHGDSTPVAFTSPAESTS